MAYIREIRGHTPQVGENTFLAETAVLVGDVTVGRDCSKHPSQTHIGNDVSVGHNAVIHGAIIEDNCLIGMGATVLDNAVVASGCIVAANALVLSGSKLEPNSVYAGIPAKKVKEITPEQRDEIVLRTARDYQLYASWFKEE